MRKKLILFTTLLAILFCLAGVGSLVMVNASPDSPVTYSLDVGDFQFDTDRDVWCGAPDDNNCYVKTNNKLSPGKTHAVALCFTAPCNGTITSSPSGSFGSVYLDTDTDKIVDGVRFSVFKNTTKIYPTTEETWEAVPARPDSLAITLSTLTMKEGDKLYYIVDNGGNGNNSWDTTYLVMGFNWTGEGKNKVWFDSATGFWKDETTGNAVYDSTNLPYAKKDLLSFHYLNVSCDAIYFLDVGEFTFNTDRDIWDGAPEDKDCYVKTNNKLNPGAKHATALCFTAPCDGTVSPSLSGSCGSVYLDDDKSVDGVRFSVFKNSEKLYPVDVATWKAVTSTSLPITLSAFEMKKGDKLYYIVDNGGNGNNAYDTTYLVMGFNWTGEGKNAVWFDSNSGRWTDEESGNAIYDSTNLPYAKKDLLTYHYLNVKEMEEHDDVIIENRKVVVNAKEYSYVQLNDSYVWGGVPGRNAYCYVNENIMAPNEYFAAAICFTAPCDGTISNGLGGGVIYRSGKVQDNTDGTRLSVVLNDTVAYPFSGVWTDIPNSEDEQLNITFNKMNISAGDKLWYIVDCGGNFNSQWDANKYKFGFVWIDSENPNGVYVDFAKCYWTDETSGAATVNFGNYQRKDVFSYHYVSLEDCVRVGNAEELNVRTLSKELEMEKLNYSQSKECYIEITDPKLIVYPDYCQPGDYDALAIVWTAPASGRVDLSNSWICNFNYHPELNINGIRSDGIRIKIVINGNKQILPVEDEWITISNKERNSIDLRPFAVNKGDKIIFVLDNNVECNWDSCNYNIVIAFAEDDADYTNTYRNIIDYRANDENAKTWSFYALVNDNSGPERQIDSLPVVSYNQNGSGCSGCSGVVHPDLPVLLVVTSALFVVITLKIIFRKIREEKYEKNN